MKKQISYDETKIKMSDDASQPEVKTSKFYKQIGAIWRTPYCPLKNKIQIKKC